MDSYIRAVVATADHIGAKLKSKRRIDISFDEWNVWYLEKHQREFEPTEWQVAGRVIEDEYTVADAVVVGNLLMSLLRNSDRVQAACLAQLVNVIAPIRSEPGGPAWRQTTFHPFALTARYAAGDVLRVETAAPQYETVSYGDAGVIDAVATYDEASGESTVFLVNRDVANPVVVNIDARGVGATSVLTATSLWDDDVYATNNEATPDRVRPKDIEHPILDGGRTQLALPPVSWTMVRFAGDQPHS